MQGNIIETPVAAITFIAVIAISYFALERNRQLLNDWALNPWAVLQERKYFLLVSHGFIHANYIHLAANMVVFLYFGFPLESVVGHFNFFIIYFGSLIIGSLISVYKKQNDSGYRSLGASGALSGVVFSVIIFFPDTTFYLFFILPIKAWIFGVLFLLFSYFASKPSQPEYLNYNDKGSFFSQQLREPWARIKYQYPEVGRISGKIKAFWITIKNRSSFIDHQGHLWGALTGLFITLLLRVLSG